MVSGKTNGSGLSFVGGRINGCGLSMVGGRIYGSGRRDTCSAEKSMEVDDPIFLGQPIEVGYPRFIGVLIWIVDSQIL